jgi:hypothetical protein
VGVETLGVAFGVVFGTAFEIWSGEGGAFWMLS